jgi:hypothetical protein
MKRLLAAAMMVPALAHAEFYSGNQVLGFINGNTTEHLFALGYVMGAADAAWGVYFCPPQGVTAGQVYDMVTKGLNNSPSLRHKSADSLIAVILGAEWPCKKPQGNRGT